MKAESQRVTFGIVHKGFHDNPRFGCKPFGKLSMIQVIRSFEREDAGSMGALPFHETTIRMPAQQFLCRFSKGPLWFCADSPLMSLFAGLGESCNESDVMRSDFKLGRRRTTLVFSLDPAVAGMRKQTLTHHHRPRAERALHTTCVR